MAHQVSYCFFHFLCRRWNKAEINSKKTHIFTLTGESIFHRRALKWGSTLQLWATNSKWFSLKKPSVFVGSFKLRWLTNLLFFGSNFFSRLVVIIMQCYRLIFLFVTWVECHIFSFFPGHAKIESWIIGRVFRFRENSANRWWAYAIPPDTLQVAQKKAFFIAFSCRP